MSETLNLAGADLRAFDPPRNGTYDVNVTGVDDVSIEREDGNLPQGTPGLKIEFTINGGDEDGKRVWNRYWLPGDDYDAEKRRKMLGMVGRFLTAVGYDEKDVISGKFKLDREDLIGRECRVTTKINNEGFANVIRVEPKSVNLEEAGLLS